MWMAAVRTRHERNRRTALLSATVLSFLASFASAQTAPAPGAKSEGAAAPSQDRLDDDGELARVRTLYDAGQYDECANELRGLLDQNGKRPLTEPQVKEDGRILHAACLIGSGRFEEADAPLRDALLANLQMKAPDSLIFPRPVIERFFRVRKSLEEKIRADEEKRLKAATAQAEAVRLQELQQRERLVQLEKLASREVVVEKNERWIAAVPFGVGQFQNRDNSLGWFFFGSELLTAGAALASFSISSHIDSQAVTLADASTPSNAGSRAQDWHLAGTISTWSFLGLAAIGVIEAQVSFVPEVRSVRSVPLPKPPEVRLPPPPAREVGLRAAPDVSASPGGVTLGVHGTF
jgi:hypothetical protein